jgi:DNA-binding transcriptional MerR regulator
MSATDVSSQGERESGAHDSTLWTAEDFSPIDAFDPDDPRYETDEDPRIPPGSSFFKIGEVAKLVGVKPYVLRFWEGEFPWVRPEKTSAKQRRYRRQDVAALLQIRRLRYDAQLTIARTRELIKDDKKRGGGHLKRLGEIGPVITVTEATPALIGRLAELRAVALDLLAAVEDEGD